MRKGRRWMLALQRQVEATWVATLDNDSVLCRDHGPELDVEPLGVELSFALVAVRVLDLEVFDRSCGTNYRDHRQGCPEGRVVDGLTLMRNSEVHVPVVVDPGISRALSVPIMREGEVWPFRGQFRIFPSWLEFDELPSAVQETTKTAERCKTSYQEFVGGRLILDSLLDAVKFFHECDPTIAAVDERGELLHFPLPAVLSVSGDRRHPLDEVICGPTL